MPSSLSANRRAPNNASADMNGANSRPIPPFFDFLVALVALVGLASVFAYKEVIQKWTHWTVQDLFSFLTAKETRESVKRSFALETG